MRSPAEPEVSGEWTSGFALFLVLSGAGTPTPCVGTQKGRYPRGAGTDAHVAHLTPGASSETRKANLSHHHHHRRHLHMGFPLPRTHGEALPTLPHPPASLDSVFTRLSAELLNRSHGLSVSHRRTPVHPTVDSDVEKGQGEETRLHPITASQVSSRPVSVLHLYLITL